MTAFLTIMTIGLPWLGALAVWLVGDRNRAQQQFAAICSVIAGGVAVLGLMFFASGEVALVIPMGGIFGDHNFAPDGMGALLATIASVVGSLTVIYSIDYMHSEAESGRYYMLVLTFIGAMCGLVLTDSLLLLFIFWEITALCSYALISFDNDNPKAVAGGIQALIMTQVGGVGLLAAALIVYGSLHTYSIATLLATASTLPPALLAIIAYSVLLAAAAKSAQVPFHTWLPGAMEAPTPVSALIHAATMVNAGVYLLARLYPAFADVPGWKLTVISIGVASALLGGLMAMASRDLKRALAYSTISQLGIMVYAVGVGAVFASQFYLLNHAVFKALLFLGAGAVIHAAGTRDLDRLAGAGNKMPGVRAAFIIGTMGLVGIPIANGFWSKELVLEAGLSTGPTWAYVAVLISVAFTAFYSIRLVMMMFFSKADWVWPLEPTPTWMQTPLWILAAGTLTTWLLVAPVGHVLSATMPYHHLEIFTIAEMVASIASPFTLVTLGVIALGWAAYGLRKPLSLPVRPLIWAARADFGFDWIVQKLSAWVSRTAGAAGRMETGHINWNIAGIAGTLTVILGYLTWSILR